MYPSIIRRLKGWFFSHSSIRSFVNVYAWRVKESCAYFLCNCDPSRRTNPYKAYTQSIITQYVNMSDFSLQSALRGLFSRLSSSLTDVSPFGCEFTLLLLREWLLTWSRQSSSWPPPPPPPQPQPRSSECEKERNWRPRRRQIHSNGMGGLKREELKMEGW